MIKHLKIVDKIYIEITLRCNIVCANCNRLVGIRTPENSDMSLEQIYRFTEQAKGRHLIHVWVCGGEPLIHPQFLDIWNHLKQAKIADRLVLCTNGTLPIPKECDNVTIVSPPKQHGNIYVSPLDMGYEPVGCENPWHCGVCLNAYGYHLCGAGFSIARLLGIVEQDTLDYLPETMSHWKDYEAICRHCHAAVKSDKNPTISSTTDPCQVKKSPIFENALKREPVKLKRWMDL